MTSPGKLSPGHTQFLGHVSSWSDGEENWLGETVLKRQFEYVLHARMHSVVALAAKMARIVWGVLTKLELFMNAEIL